MCPDLRHSLLPSSPFPSRSPDGPEAPETGGQESLSWSLNSGAALLSALVKLLDLSVPQTEAPLAVTR